MQNSKTDLKPKQKKCIELMVLGTLTQKEIAEQLNIAQSTICAWKKNAEFCDAYNIALKESMRDATGRAFRTIVDLLHSNNDGVRLAAARDILDRAGFKAENSVSVEISKSGKLAEIMEQLGGDGLEE